MKPTLVAYKTTSWPSLFLLCARQAARLQRVFGRSPVTCEGVRKAVPKEIFVGRGGHKCLNVVDTSYVPVHRCAGRWYCSENRDLRNRPQNISIPQCRRGSLFWKHIFCQVPRDTSIIPQFTGVSSICPSVRYFSSSTVYWAF